MAVYIETYQRLRRHAPKAEYFAFEYDTPMSHS